MSRPCGFSSREIYAFLPVSVFQVRPAAASLVGGEFPGLDANRLQLEHVHCRLDCPGDLFTRTKLFPAGQPLA